jgi:hypothetical protein
MKARGAPCWRRSCRDSRVHLIAPLPSSTHWIVEGSARPAARGLLDNKPETRVKFLRMPLDLGHDGTHLRGTPCSARFLEKDWRSRRTWARSSAAPRMARGGNFGDGTSRLNPRLIGRSRDRRAAASATRGPNDLSIGDRVLHGVSAGGEKRRTTPRCSSMAA